MRLLTLLDATPLDDEVLRATRRLTEPGETVVLCSILPEREVREAFSSRLPGSHDGSRLDCEQAESRRPALADSRSAAAPHLVPERERHLLALAARELPDRETEIEVAIARVPTGHVLRLARQYAVDAIITGVEAVSWYEQLRGADRARALIAAAEVPVFVVPSGASVGPPAANGRSALPAGQREAPADILARVVERTSLPAFGLDESSRLCALSAAAVTGFAIDRERVIGRPCYEVLRPTDPAAAEACGEGCPLLDRLRAGETVDFGSHVWRAGADPTPFAAISIPLSAALDERHGAGALVIVGGRS